jgi:ketosteroid isomerase-like protein
VDRDVTDDTATVIARHLAAVRDGDPEAMAADYAADAVLERPDGAHHGHAAIAAYFRTVPERLGGGEVVFGESEIEGEVAVITWRIVGGPGDGASGRDTCVVRDGAIVHQRVQLAGDDF